MDFEDLNMHDGDNNEASINTAEVDSSYPDEEKANFQHLVDNEPTERKPVKKNRKKKDSFGKTIAKAICVALIFGAVAGGTFRLVNYIGNGKGSSNNSGKEIVYVNQAGGSIVSDAGDVSGLVDEVMPSIVAVNTTVEKTVRDFFGREYKQSGNGAGSGVIISESSEDYYILTNNHVVENSVSVTVTFNDDAVADAEVMGYYEDEDIAVLSVKKSNVSVETQNAIKPAGIANSDEVKVGEMSVAIGNAMGYGQSVTKGIISAVNREVKLSTGSKYLIQTDAAINPGNSGGALLDASGNVIGINTVKYATTTVEGMGFAIPINTAMSYAEKIISGTYAEEKQQEADRIANAAYLGIYGATITKDMASEYNCPQGAIIKGVIRGSAADIAGFRTGDIIIGIDDHEVTGMDDVLAILDANYSAGDTAVIRVAIPDSDWNYKESREYMVTFSSKNDIDINDILQ